MSDDSNRFPSIDTLRGTLLLLFLARGFGLLNEQMLNQAQWGWISRQFAHRSWGDGCSLWDLLQPGMLFVVGLAMPFSYANRQSAGQSWSRQFSHALVRTAVLFLLGVYVDSYRENRFAFDPRGELQQLALAYFLAFMLLPLGLAVQGVTVGFLLIGQTAGYAIYSVAGGHDLWAQAQNLGTAVDYMLRLSGHRDSLVTLNLVSAAATVILGMLVGGLMRTGLTAGMKVIIMTGASFAAILLSWLLSGGGGWVDFSWRPLIPLIPRIGTLTFVLTAVGWMLLVFAYFYTLMEGFGLHLWALPVMVVGRNSLLVFLASVFFRDWAERSARLFLPSSPPILFRLQPLLMELIVVLIFWLWCFWLYRRRIFFKV